MYVDDNELKISRSTFWCRFAVTIAVLILPISLLADSSILPDPAKDTFKLKDFSDRGFTPVAWHTEHSSSWLGHLVDEEAQPNDPDNFDDGVFVVTPRNFRPGNIVVLAAVVRTRWALRPNFFNQPPSTNKLGIWIDWDYNHDFSETERVVSKNFNPPFSRDGVNSPHNIFFFSIQVPQNYQPRTFEDERGGDHLEHPTVRARVAFNHQDEQIQAGMSEVYGEVEDIVISPNDIVMYEESGPYEDGYASLPPVGRFILGRLLGDAMGLTVLDSGGATLHAAVVESLHVDDLREAVSWATREVMAAKKDS